MVNCEREDVRRWSNFYCHNQLSRHYFIMRSYHYFFDNPCYRAFNP